MRASERVAERASRVAARVAAAPYPVRSALAIFWLGAAFAIMMVRHVCATTVVGIASEAMASLGLSGPSVGALTFLFWTAIPFALYAAALRMQRRIEPYSVGSWSSTLFFALAFSGFLSRDEAFQVLSQPAAAVYDWLVAAALIVGFVGLGVYGVVKLIHWLIAYKRNARTSG